MYRKIKAGSTSVSAPIFIADTSSSVGGGLASLVYNTSGLTAKYRREGVSSWTSITLATATLGTWTSGGFIADTAGIDGLYEIGIPNAALATGAKWVEIILYGAANMLATTILIELDNVDYNDSQFFGLSGFSGVLLSPQGRTEVASGVWTSTTSDYSGVNQFGRELQPIYYADIKQYYDFDNARDEYGVDWYRGNTILFSGGITNQRISAYSSVNSAALFENKDMTYAGTQIGTLRYNDATNVMTAGEPYNVIVSGTIDGSTRIWQKVIGRSKLS